MATNHYVSVLLLGCGCRFDYLSLNVRRVIATIMASNHRQNSKSITPLRFGTTNFSHKVKSPGFIDKTPLLKEILGGEFIILITVARRFGKSTNTDMVKKFIEFEVDTAGSPDRNIFNNNLLIFQDQEFIEQHFATYPVIRTTFKSVRANS